MMQASIYIPNFRNVLHKSAFKTFWAKKAMNICMFRFTEYSNIRTFVSVPFMSYELFNCILCPLPQNRSGQETRICVFQG